MKYAHAIAAFTQTCWALREETFLAMQSVLMARSEGTRWSSEEIRERIDESNEANGYVPIARDEAHFLGADGRGGIPTEGSNGRRNSAAAPGSIAVIPMVGIISNRMSMIEAVSGASAGASVQRMTAQFRQALDDDGCSAILFDVDSPGGGVNGVMEFASEILSARSYKRIIAVVNGMSCSAAYWLASAASEVVCSPSSQAGSIGVFMTHYDESEALKKEGIKVTTIKAGKYKNEGTSSEPLSDGARAAFQSQVDDYYSSFVRAVAQNRRATQAAVRDGYGQGRSLLANEALRQNLVDRIGTFDDALASLGVRVSGKRGGKAAPGLRLTAAQNQLALMSIHGRDGATPNRSTADGQRQNWIRNEQLAAMRRGSPIPSTTAIPPKDDEQRRDWLRRQIELRR
jgi:capsid assembly protease